MNRVIFLTVLAVVLVMSGCSGNEKTEEEKVAEAIEDAFGEQPAKEETPESKLQEIDSYVTGLWNDGFVNVSWYTSQGTNSTGETMDIEFTLERLKEEVEKKPEYDSYIQGLGTEYDGIKSVWNKLSEQIDILNDHLQNNPPKAETEYDGFDTGFFEQYHEAFGKDVDALIEKAQ